jgi:non-specific serine/threonine protein kinase
MGGRETLDVLGRLVDKSFVIARPAESGTRYRLLDTLRHYAWGRLQAAREEELARRRHLEHFLARAEALYVPTESIDGATRVLDDDLDNLRSAFEWCQTADAQAGLRLIGSTRSIWFRHDLAEGRRWAYVFLGLCPEPSLFRCYALLTGALLEGFGGADSEQAQRLLEQARDLGSELGDRAGHLWAEFLLGCVAYLDGRAVDALGQLNACLPVSEELGDAGMTARILFFLGLVLMTDRSRRDEARATLERAQRVGAEVGDRYTSALIEYAFGLYWRWTGHAQRALAHFRNAASALREIGEVANLSIALLHIARLVADRDALQAARLAGAALAIGEHAGTRRGTRINRAADQLRAELQTRLGAELARRAWVQGAGLSVDEAVTLALEDRRSQTTHDDALSPRELEVARLVAQSLTSAQIASELHLSPRTVDNHLAHIFNKLGLSSRLQLATWLVSGEPQRS